MRKAPNSFYRARNQSLNLLPEVLSSGTGGSLLAFGEISSRVTAVTPRIKR